MGSTPQVRCFHSIIEHIFPSTYILPQIYYNINQILTVLMYMIQIFVVITEESTTNDIHRGKNISPQFCMLMVVFLFPSQVFLSKFSNVYLLLLFQYHSLLSWFQYIPRLLFLLDLPSLTPIFLSTCIQENHQKTLYMDVVILDTYLNI